MDTYIDDNGIECCDNCDTAADECACCCIECGDHVTECACPEGPSYPA